MLYYVVGYRKKIVIENIQKSFPYKTSEEHLAITKKFYKQVCDLFLESMKIFTVSKRNIKKYISCSNPEVINSFFDQGKNVVIAVGHYNSWELMLAGINEFIKHQAIVIYQPLSNSFLDKKLCAARSRMGTQMLPAAEVKSFFKSKHDKLFATVFAIDQSPPNPEKSYWMEFLHQDTPVLFGSEKYAKDFNQPVVYAHLNRVKRGLYNLEFELVVTNPAETAYGEITERVTKILEQDIIKAPEFWLWSHRRWKHKR